MKNGLNTVGLYLNLEGLLLRYYTLQLQFLLLVLWLYLNLEGLLLVAITNTCIASANCCTLTQRDCYKYRFQLTSQQLRAIPLYLNLEGLLPSSSINFPPCCISLFSCTLTQSECYKLCFTNNGIFMLLKVIF